MNRIFVTAMAIMLLAGGPAWATIPSTQKSQAQLANPAQEAAQMVQQAFTDIQHNNVISGQAEIDKAIQTKGFIQLPMDLQYRVLWIASMLAEQDGQDKKAHDMAVRATTFDAADSTVWMVRTFSAMSTADYHDAAHGVTVLAQRWPDKLSSILPGAIIQLHFLLKQAQDDAMDREMLDALFDAKWKNNGNEPGSLWRDLALQYLNRKDVARATTVSKRITSARTALSMLVDKRFDPITRKYPEAFNVGRLISVQITTAQARMKAHPDQLSPIVDLQKLYLATGKNPRVLSISDAAVAQAKHGTGDTTYTDFATRYNWVLDCRSRAWKREGHWKQAIREEMVAARRPEFGSMNVSQLINLGNLYANLGQSDKAANAIVELGDLSPIGHMQLESVRLRIAVAKKDKAAITSAMSYLRQHRADDIRTWEDALLLRGKLDVAAALLIERLKNPAWRSDALVDMQHYADVVETPVEKTIRNRWDTVTRRPDVQAAMHMVGRVERFRIAAPLR